ncbi:DNA internalization-related competence protein ComEC/Rec2 [Parahaliea aestuarii]|uniref:DNA internalization-related competence protein ComEC/Rec2 n=1 Tax=Parahaliea aestuarii TaxID=1852021 RepID=A0A5C8ZZD0_9GAMM|nr:DNA internalization-related competence protein ComEC/Rec2 [Parahaliea aestuarii]TXS93159.1 DNA internalization-related competence protein ComEC/Rec2 [Parahaliea aestuarii]
MGALPLVLAIGLLATGWLPRLPGAAEQVGMALTALVLACSRWRATGIALAALVVGVLIACYFGQALLSRALPKDCVRLPVQVEGRVVSLPRVSRFDPETRQQRFEFAVSSVSPARCSGPRRLLLSHYGDEVLAPGESWRFEVLLRRPWGLVNPGSFNMQAWFAQTGIDATGSVRSRDGAAQRLPVPQHGLWHHRLRGRLSERIGALRLPADSQAVLQAVTVADRSALDSDLWRLFQVFGLNHLLVISGLHIGLVAGLGYLLGRVLVLPLQWAGYTGAGLLLPALTALVLAVFYAALAGFSLATVRALTMLFCVVAASWLGRGAGAWHNLLLAALVLLLCNPLAGLGSGFWLSFGAVACLLWRLQWGSGRSGPLQMILTHVYMALAMVPLAGGWFGGASLVSAPANLLAVPLLGLWVVPLSLLATGLALLETGLADTLWRWAAVPLNTLLPLAATLQQARPAWLYWHFSPGPAQLALAVVAVGLAVFPLPRWRRFAALCLLLAPALLPPKQARTAGPNAVHLAFIDVGQGTSVLLYDRERALLYDTGGGVPGGPTVADSVVVPLLRQRGIRHLDTLVLSHGDSDHSAGWRDVVDSVRVDAILTGADLDIAGARRCVAGRAWQWPGAGVVVRILAPALEASSGLSSNNASCVLQVQIGGEGLLLAGDIDVERERELVRYWRSDLRSDWLLVAHHGSKTSSGFAFLKQVAPAHAVVSAGYANRFGHPHPGVVARLQAERSRVWYSASEGALEVIFRPGQAPQVISHRRQRPYYWQ